tara:strand:+ start:102 stop:656 length:555 start_codon:yes stop_codon:yes gene_type:complete
MAEQPKSTVSPTMPSSGVLERFLDYINQPLNTEDPIQNLVSGVAEFIPGLSTELARRRGDTMDEALSYLDVVGGGALKGSLFLIERKKMLEKALKELDSDPILKMNPDAGNTLRKQLADVDKQLTDNKAMTESYKAMLDDKGIVSQSPPAKLDDLLKAAERQNKIMRKREGDDFVDDFFFKKPD